MPISTKETMRKGFSLLELLIVIVIVSMVYFLGFSAFEKPTNRAQNVTVLKLKHILHPPKHASKPLTFMCVDHCRSCFVRKDISSPFTPYKLPIDLIDAELYRLDADNEPIRQEYGRYNDKKISLLIHFYRNGSSTQFILKTKKGIYFFPAFFGKAKAFETLEDARDFWVKESQLLTDQGAFY
jgi:prepilin-type N-terminal cleavage/methylation domain-containing protein